MRDRLAFGLGVLALQCLSLCFTALCIAQEAAPTQPADPPADPPAAQSTAQSTTQSPAQALAESAAQTLGESQGIATPAESVKAWETEPCPGNVRCVIVADAFLEMHTGPGVGYPVFHVIGRGETVQVRARRTDWFYVRSSREYEGWVHRSQMISTLELDGQPTTIKEPTRGDYTARTWEAGLFAGRFEGASLLAIYGAFGFTEHLSAELHIANAVGNVSDNLIGSLGLNHIFAPEWRVSPYVILGTGVIYSKTRSTLVQPEDTVDQIGYVGGGVRGYIARRFLGRFEYRRNVAFTSSNENEEIHEWKLGFGFFF